MDLKRRLTSAGAIVVGPILSIRQALSLTLDLIEDGALITAALDANLGNDDTAYTISVELDA